MEILDSGRFAHVAAIRAAGRVAVVLLETRVAAPQSVTAGDGAATVAALLVGADFFDGDFRLELVTVDGFPGRIEMVFGIVDGHRRAECEIQWRARVPVFRRSDRSDFRGGGIRRFGLLEDGHVGEIEFLAIAESRKVGIEVDIVGVSEFRGFMGDLANTVFG